jgi:hypothetical protein
MFKIAWMIAIKIILIQKFIGGIFITLIISTLFFG